ncbi:MAG: DoxX family membrane protein [candidate division KSB1 bacterium]|nr:DoxX family membrane protein [candidate division KSB1 bacterium]MDZ7364763.1 DoxX family membrane protein [candidate division KSB1 bacterium]MDZ7402489.1 DoxX family membrane protein [candidate division KSB1 bacterium]
MNTERIRLALRLLLGAVFIFSAVSKLLGAGLFEIAIVDQGLMATREQAAYPARLVIAFELFLGVALFFPFYLKRIILPLAIITLVAFTLLQGYQMTLGEQTQDCGCFGALLPMSSAESLAKNFILLGLSLWLFKITREEKRQAIFPSLLAAVSLAAVFVLAPVRRNYDETFAKYTQFEKAGRVDLTSGDKLVAVFNAECDHCQQTARELGELAAKTANFPQIYVLMFSEQASSIPIFSEKTNTDYPYHVISLDDFVGLIGASPPRIYWLQDGKVKAHWDEDFANHIIAAFKLLE